MRTVNFSDARSNLKAVLDTVVDDCDVTLIKRRDAQDVVMMSLATWNRWKESEYLLANPANARRLLNSIADLDAGRGQQRELIEPAAALAVGEPRRAYKISTKASKPGKRTGPNKRKPPRG
ncbi:MAG: type II toxin-antitoxin system Phd/YefM family antitoxin [Proteobacteria bacterium]|nr:type II toxin-antitoxin system Phd/YefM family antitoxin [Pseudomonadota bacterium]